MGRLYRTGDLVRCDGEGKFHYEGRADSQVKPTAPLWLFALGTALLFDVYAEVLTAWLAAPTLSLPILLSSLAVATLPLPLMLIVEAVACRAIGRIQPGVHYITIGSHDKLDP